MEAMASAPFFVSVHRHDSEVVALAFVSVIDPTRTGNKVRSMRTFGATRMMMAATAMLGVATMAPAAAETPRDILTQASFADGTKAQALQHIAQAQRSAATTLARSSGDHEALVMLATAAAYKAKLDGNRTAAIAARKQFEGLVARFPNDPEPLLGLGAWHMGAVFKLGGLMGRAALGAQRSVGLKSLDRAVALGGDRALYAGLAALLRLEQDAGDARGLALAETASRAGTPTAFDRIMRRSAAAVLDAARTRDVATTKKLAARLLPFGRFDD